MSERELSELFDTMRIMFCIPGYMQEFSAEKWRVLKNVWRGVFGAESIENVWNAVRKYASEGGKYWPYPGEIGKIIREQRRWRARQMGLLI